MFRNVLKQPLLLLVLAMVAMSTGPSAAQKLSPGTTAETVNILPDVQYLRDPSGKLSLKDILRPAADKAFRTFQRPYISASDAEAVHWFRFEAEASRQSDYRASVYFTDPGVSRMILFRQVVAANADVFQYDPYIGDDDTVAKSGGIGLPLRVSAGERRTIYVSIQGASLAGRLELWDPAALDAHLRTQATWRYSIYGCLGLAALLALFAFYKSGNRNLLFVPVACTAYGVYFVLLNSALILPSWLGTFKLELFCTALFATSLVQLAAGSLNIDLSSLKIRWWGFVIGFALLSASILSAFNSNASILFSYVLMVAAVLVCLFTAVALLTLKNASVYQAKALQAVLFAVAIGLSPEWSLNTLALGILPHAFIAVTLIISAALSLLAAQTLASEQDAALDQEIDIDRIDTDGALAALWTQEEGAPDASAKEANDEPVFVEAASTQVAAAETVEDSGPSFAQIQKKVVELSSNEPVQIEPPVIPSVVDEMTGVFNVLTVNAIGRKAIAQVKRYHRAHTAILLRIEGFDELRDTLGKPTSNRAAKLVAVTTMRELRESDSLGRLRDDMFLALMPETDLTGAYVAMARMKDNLVERALPTRAGMRKISVSFSAAAIVADDEDFDEVLERLESDLSTDIPTLGRSPRPSQSQAAE